MAVKRNSARKTALIPFLTHGLRWTLLAGALLIITLHVSWLTAQPIRSAAPVIVLDPGHGGHDHGARGPSGSTEKDICLALTREVATRLEAAHYEVLLTRSDDYDVDLRQRTAIANHAGAEIFISIHAAAGFLHGTEAMTIFYHQTRDPALPQSDMERSGRPWQQQPAAQIARSRDLAHALLRALGPVNRSSMVDITQAPIRVLEGAEMPAVLVEVGCLTHAATEQKLSSQPHLDSLASALVRGIDSFYTGLPTSGRQ